MQECAKCPAFAEKSKEVPDFVALQQLATKSAEQYEDCRDIDIITSHSERVINDITETRDEIIRQVELWYEHNVAEVKKKVNRSVERQMVWQGLFETELKDIKRFIDETEVILDRTDDTSTEPETKTRLAEIAEESVRKATSMMTCLKTKPRIPHMSFVFAKGQVHLALSNCGHLSFETTPDYTSIEYKRMTTTNLHSPRGICINQDTGLVVVSDTAKGSLHMFDDNLEYLYTPNDKLKNVWPYGVAVNRDGIIYVSELLNHRISVVDKRGNVLFSFGKKGSGNDMYKAPAGLAFDQQGLLYICDSNNHRVKITDKNGKFVKDFGQDVFGSKTPRDITISHKKIAVTDFSGNLYIFSTDGDHVRTAQGNAPPHNINYTGVTFDKQSYLHVTDCKQNKLLVVNENGEPIAFYGDSGSDSGCVREPEGIAVTRTGDVIVCDKVNHRVQLFLVPDL